jgi:hypothetical protein
MTTLETARPVEAEDQDRAQSAAVALYFRNQSDIRDSILSGTGLWVGDADHILELIAQHLPQYDGPDDDEAFLAWAKEVSGPEVEKFKFFYQLQDKYHGSVSAGIWSVLKRNRDLAHYDSINATADDLADLAWQWIFFRLDEFAVAGTAKLGTRLYAAARFTALTWRKTRLRERERDAGIDVELIGKKADGDYVVDEEEDDQSDFGADGVPASLNYAFDTESEVLDEEIPSRP